MSSHHFVREDQEPGLLILDWLTNADELIMQLAQWAPKIIVHEKALEQFLLHGYKADVVLANDVKLCEDLVKYQYPIKIEKSQEYVEGLLKHVKDEFIDRFNVIGDVTCSDLGVETKGMVFYNSTVWFHYILKGFQKWLPLGMNVTIVESGRESVIEGKDSLYTYEGKGAFFVQKY